MASYITIRRFNNSNQKTYFWERRPRVCFKSAVEKMKLNNSLGFLANKEFADLKELGHNCVLFSTFLTLIWC